jgi:TPR repeat protein
MGGECVPALGLIYCAQAAAQSSSHAMLELGKAFARGLYGVPQDAGQAKFWLDKGVSAGQSGTFIDRFEAALKSYSARRLLEELRAWELRRLCDVCGMWRKKL